MAEVSEMQVRISSEALQSDLQIGLLISAMVGTVLGPNQSAEPEAEQLGSQASCLHVRRKSTRSR